MCGQLILGGPWGMWAGPRCVVEPPMVSECIGPRVGLASLLLLGLAVAARSRKWFVGLDKVMEEDVLEGG